MKKQSVITLILLTLLCSVNFIETSVSKENDSTIYQPEINAGIRPIFAETDANTTIIQLRTSTRGALCQSNLYNNVTIWYKYQGGDDSSAPILFIDDGNGTYHPDGILMQFDNEKYVAEADGYGYYNFTLNMTSNFVSFRARYGEYEDDFGLYNYITADETKVESYFWEPYYTQLEDIFMNLTIYNYNITGYGFRYRDVTENYDAEYENVTYVLASASDEFTLNVSFSHSFEHAAVVQVQAFIIQKDNMTTTDRFFYENRFQTFTVADATPVIELDVQRYTNDLNVSLSWTATVLNSNITAFDIDWGDLSGVQSINISKHTYYHEYATVGEYDIVATAYAVSLESNLTISVLIEQINPIGSVKIITPDGRIINVTGVPEITLETKQLDFILNGSDSGGSGIEKIILSTGEGNSVEISEDGVVTLHFMEYGFIELTITVVDFAGNEFSETFFIQIIQKVIPTFIGVPFPFGITTFIGLISIAVFMYLRKRK